MTMPEKEKSAFSARALDWQQLLAIDISGSNSLKWNTLKLWRIPLRKKIKAIWMCVSKFPLRQVVLTYIVLNICQSVYTFIFQIIFKNYVYRHFQWQQTTTRKFWWDLNQIVGVAQRSTIPTARQTNEYYFM